MPVFFIESNAQRAESREQRAMKESAFADNTIYQDPVVKPQDDTYERDRNINLNDVHKMETIIPPLSFWGLTPESRYMMLRAQRSKPM